MAIEVTYVALRPPAAAEGNPSLTPELLAATGARYSRNNEGLAAILAHIDPADPDRIAGLDIRAADQSTDTVTARSWCRARPSLKRVPAASPFTEAAAPPASCISPENC